MARDDAKPKLGAGHAEAMARQGLAELRAAFYAGSNIAQPTEYGIWGRPTPQEVVESKEEDLSGGVVSSRVEEPARSDADDGRSHEPPEPERA